MLVVFCAVSAFAETRAEYRCSMAFDLADLSMCNWGKGVRVFRGSKFILNKGESDDPEMRARNDPRNRNRLHTGSTVLTSRDFMAALRARNAVPRAPVVEPVDVQEVPIAAEQPEMMEEMLAHGGASAMGADREADADFDRLTHEHMMGTEVARALRAPPAEQVFGDPEVRRRELRELREFNRDVGAELRVRLGEAAEARAELEHRPLPQRRGRGGGTR
jgi:hypothetical protein